ncbi:MAG: LysM peptidoglycan-binding domain-containing protein [Ardenticatenaceae bacterium]|nr:LysM peptidoglycan-binding domain-containing protein [Ardenticatenaceae bacterium]
MQKPQSSIIMLIIIVAVILAIASSLALLALQDRPDTPEEQVTEGEQAPAETQVINVEGVDIAVRRTVDNALFMQPITPVQPESAQPEQQTQEQPAEQQTEQTQEQPAEQQTEQTQEQPAEQQTEQTQEQPIELATAVPLNTANQTVDAIIYQSYVVQANDSLYNITRQLNTSITLMAVKGIDQEDLVAGQTIQVPIGNPAYCPGLSPYAVAEGDTIFSIAQRRNTTPDNLRTINTLDANYTIYSGTIICVP